jgi:hypothetical protein
MLLNSKYIVTDITDEFAINRNKLYEYTACIAQHVSALALSSVMYMHKLQFT